MEPESSLCIYNSPPPVPVLIQIDPVCDPHPTSLRSILISFHLCLGLSSALLPSRPIRDTCPAHRLFPYMDETIHPTRLSRIWPFRLHLGINSRD